MIKDDSLDQVYRDLDVAVAKFEREHRDRLQCKKGCFDCCVDDITVFEIEAHHIVANCGDVLEQHAHQVGACAFLDQDGACRIYAYRPYVCRTQGLPLRWLDEDESGQWVELRDICYLNETGEPIEDLAQESCWEIGPFEGRLAMLQAKVDDDELRRVPFRSLFHKVEQA